MKALPTQAQHLSFNIYIYSTVCKLSSHKLELLTTAQSIHTWHTAAIKFAFSAMTSEMHPNYHCYF